MKRIALLIVSFLAFFLLYYKWYFVRGGSVTINMVPSKVYGNA